MAVKEVESLSKCIFGNPRLQNLPLAAAAFLLLRERGLQAAVRLVKAKFGNGDSDNESKSTSEEEE